jgi:hypothetical protein
MTDNQNQTRKMVPRSGGFFQDLADRFRLIGRLMMDSRVNPFLKVLPIGTLIYVFSPIDLLSVNPIDDAFIIWAGTTLFVEMCPPHVVEEHMKALQQVVSGQWRDFPRGASQEEIVDGEYVDTTPGGRTTPGG